MVVAGGPPRVMVVLLGERAYQPRNDMPMAVEPVLNPMDKQLYSRLWSPRVVRVLFYHREE